MDQNVVSISQDIRDMKIRGAGRIARAGADAMGKFAEGYQGKDMAAFRKDLDEAVGVILGSRPTAVSLWNGVQSSISGAKSAGTVPVSCSQGSTAVLLRGPVLPAYPSMCP